MVIAPSSSGSTAIRQLVKVLPCSHAACAWTPIVVAPPVNRLEKGSAFVASAWTVTLLFAPPA
jgi:hypothetical protein